MTTLVICTRCKGTGKEFRKDGFRRKCEGCGGVGRRAPIVKRRTSPWGLTPAALSGRALARWDWNGAAKRAQEVNAERLAKGMIPLPVPKRTKSSEQSGSG